MIKAITFDLWDTVIDDDSDEPKRAGGGLPSKRELRRRLARQALGAVDPEAAARVDAAYDVMEAAFNHVWHEHDVTWTVDERVEVLLSGLGAEIAGDARAELVLALEEMELDVAPDPVPGIGEAVAELAERYPLGVVSDAIYTPGRCLRHWLELHGLRHHFRGFAFSDEVGRSKPHPSMFAAAARQLGVEVHEMLHVGDRERNDVRGPHALGMRAVLFTATRTRDLPGNTADAVCEAASRLPEVVQGVIDRAA